MTDHKAEPLLIIAGSLLDRHIQRSGTHTHIFRGCNISGTLGNIIGVLIHKFSVCLLDFSRPGFSHSKNTFKDSQQSTLIHIIPVAVDLVSYVCHEINPARHIIGKIGFCPAHHAPIGENTLFKGVCPLCGQVGFTVIVQRIPADQPEEGKNCIDCSGLGIGDESFPQTLVGNNRF